MILVLPTASPMMTILNMKSKRELSWAAGWAGLATLPATLGNRSATPMAEPMEVV